MSSPRGPIVNLAPESRRKLGKLWMRLQQVPSDTTARPLIGAPDNSDNSGGGGNLLGDVIGSLAATVVQKIQGYAVARTPPAAGQALVWDAVGESWTPGAPGTPSGEIIDFNTLVNEALTGSGASATASSSLVRGALSFSPGSTIDNDDATYHETEPGIAPAPPVTMVGQWVRVNLGSAKAITYARFKGAGPRQWKIQSSPDDTTWTDRYSGTGSGVTDQDSGYLDLGGAQTFRYWRFYVTQGPADETTHYRVLRTFTLALYSGAPLVQAPGHMIQDEGTPALQRPSLNFVGQGVAVTDDGAGARTTVTIPGTDVYATDAELAAAVALLIAKGLIDAKGDLIVGTADNVPARLAVGTDGQVLTADAASSAGVTWAASSGGGGGGTRYEPLTNGNPASPELVFDATGDVIMVPTV
jgi:hypothetical protein